jgi:hypothetical protein
MALHVAVVQPERELVNLPAKVVRIDMVVNAVHAALEHASHGLDIVGAHAVAHILASRMADRLVLVEQPAETLITAVLVCVQLEPVWTFRWITGCRVAASVPDTVCALVRPPRSRMPTTAVLPTVPRPA